eukprot:TRINITY_DN66205_c0_g1_i1.p1 TRINITY_DN66205_c0_g1~~TRINITY_DN66205_c0_g1_i1.p1  ORF type:complete len:179 (-),score=22.07 TRINITY_DN66205_c0_g1_i1:283-819(-)
MDERHVLCIRNLPCKILEDDLMEVMLSLGLDLSRYQLHFPKARRRRRQFINVGYGFATCWCAEDAHALVERLQGYRFENIQSAKQLTIERANSSITDVSSHSNQASFASANTPASAETDRHDDAAGPLLEEDETLIPAPASSRIYVPDAIEVPPTSLAASKGHRTRWVVDSGVSCHDH